jgi:hypothetical protein
MCTDSSHLWICFLLVLPKSSPHRVLVLFWMEGGRAMVKMFFVDGRSVQVVGRKVFVLAIYLTLLNKKLLEKKIVLIICNL